MAEELKKNPIFTEDDLRITFSLRDSWDNERMNLEASKTREELLASLDSKASVSDELKKRFRKLPLRVESGGSWQDTVEHVLKALIRAE